MDTPAVAQTPPINLDITLGALLVGTYISTALFGFTSLQTYNYFTNFPDDRKPIKALVSGVFLLVSALLTVNPQVAFIWYISARVSVNIR